MRYAQRIDVDEWRHCVPAGVSVKGLDEIPPNEIQLALFEIGKSFFDRLEKALAGEHALVPSMKKLARAHPDGHAADALSRAAVQVTDAGYFSPSPSSFTGERERRLREVVVRRGQPEFRSRLIAAYGGRCAVTGCDALAALEAAHITPLRRAAHATRHERPPPSDTLFDIDLIGIDPDLLSVSVSPAIKESVYGDLQGQMLAVP